MLWYDRGAHTISYGLDTAFFFCFCSADAPPRLPPPPPLSLGSLELGCTVGGLALPPRAWVMVMVSCVTVMGQDSDGQAIRSGGRELGAGYPWPRAD